MKRILFIFIIFGACHTSLYAGNTVFAFSVDTVFVSTGDSATVVYPRNIVLSVGDTARAWIWYYSTDSMNWRVLYGFKGNMIEGDSIMIDTLPIYRYYAAYLHAGLSTDFIVWKIKTIAYRGLKRPVVTNDVAPTKKELMMLKYDSVRLFVAFQGVQPDKITWWRKGWQPEELSEVGTSLVKTNGRYFAKGTIHNRLGKVIDEVVSDTTHIRFERPFGALIVRSWAGSNDGRPRTVDTIYIDTCKSEMVLDTLRFVVGDAYKYELVPLLFKYDRPYKFEYRWVHDGFTVVIGQDSILTFDPLGFQHTGLYTFITTHVQGTKFTDFRGVPVRIIAHNTSNINVNGMDAVVMGTIYNIAGQIIKQNVSGSVADIVRYSDIPKGVYFLRDRNSIYKFIKTK